MGKPQDHTIVFAGAGEREIQDRGKYLRVLDAPTADIFLQFDGSGEIERGAGAQISDSDGFKKVRIRSTVAQTVRVSISDQPQDDNRQEVNVNATATVLGATVITPVPLVEVGAGLTVQLAAGDPDRIELRLALASDEPGPVWIGPAGVGDEEGGLLEPGMVDYPATTAAVFAHNPHATLSVFVSVLDLTAP
jgi:hypothetical protein